MLLQILPAKLRSFFKQRPQAAIAILVFSICVFVYLSNNDAILISNDNVPTTLQALNWIQNHSFNLDNFRNSSFYQVLDEEPYFLTEAPNGHLVSTYPIGSAFVTFPLYLITFLGLKISIFFQSLFTSSSANLPDLASLDFEPYRKGLTKVVATLCTAFSVVIFYLIVRLKFQQATAFIITFLFAFATSTWVLCSQDVRQHTVSNLLVLSIIFCLFKANRFQANRSHKKRQDVMLLLAGIFCGLLPGVRLTSGIFSAATFAFVLYTYRKESLFFLLGLPSVLINITWNIYFFGLKGWLSGGYSQMFDAGASSYKISFPYFTEAFLGQLISPSDGLLIFSPVLLFAFPGAFLVFKRRSGKDEQLIVCLTLACLGLFLHYCFYVPWTGGSGSFGARFLSDTVPILCLLIAYFFDELIQSIATWRKWVHRLVFSTFLVLLLLSTFVQTVGAFTRTDWGTVPVPILTSRSRLWQFRDSQIERHTRNLLAQIHSPIANPETYVENLAGSIDRLEWIRKNGTAVPIDQTLTMRRNYQRILRLQLKNTGQSEWYGYENGMVNLGETQIRVLFYNETGERIKLKSSGIFISGNIKPGETVEAIGRVNFPRRKGTYEARFVLLASGMEDTEDIAEESQRQLYRLKVNILPALKS